MEPENLEKNRAGAERPSATETAPVAGTDIGQLSYNVPQIYRTTGQVSARGLIATLIVGLFVSLAAGIGSWFLMKNFSAGIFIPLGIQAFVVGKVLGNQFHREKLRNPALAIGIAILCGIVCAGVFQAAVYVQSVYDLPTQLQNELIRRGIREGSPQMQRAMASIAGDAFQTYDRIVLFPNSGHRGFLAFMRLRTPKVWTAILIQVGVIAWISANRARRSASRPFCEGCDVWFNEPFNAAVVPGALADPLVIAIERDEPEEVLTVLRLVGRDLGQTVGIARLYRCPKCSRQLVDMLIKTYSSGTRSSTRMALRNISAETAMALRSEIAEPVAAPATTEQVTDESLANG